MPGKQMREDRWDASIRCFLRWCSKCREWLPIECFWIDKGNGLPRRQCVNCMRASGTAWWRRNRKGKPRGWRKTS